MSNHKHELRIGNVQGDDLSFEFGLANNPAYVEQGLYAKHLARWQALFPAEQILVLKFDDVVVKPAETLSRVCDFLGVDPAYESPHLKTKSNVSYLHRSSALDKMKNAVRGVVRGVGLGGLWQRLGDTGLRDKYRSVNRLEAESVIGLPKAETLQQLKSVFRPDLDEFERMTGVSTADWLQQ